MKQYRISPDCAEAPGLAAAIREAEPREDNTARGPEHRLAVASLVLYHGGRKEEILGALLQDEIEGSERDVLQSIRSRFGTEVAQIVKECSEALPSPEEKKQPWVARKEEHLAMLPTTSKAAQLVCLADKVQSLRSLAIGYARQGEAVWSKLNGGKQGTFWYYWELIGVFRQSTVSRELVAELEKAFVDLKRLTQANTTVGPTFVDSSG